MVTKVKAVDSKIPIISGLVTKTQYDSDKLGIEKKLEHVDKKVPNTSQKTWLHHKSYRYQISLISLPKQILTQKLQILKWKYQILVILLILRNSTD